ncbi:MAG: type II toxin-antitoxin system CcdA family antitoxin [Mariprofundus sp.]
MSKSAKRAVNLRINERLIDQAKALHINLSQTLETSLVEVLREKQQRAWLEDNKDAIIAYNRRIEKQGVFSDGLRQF